MLLNGTRDKLLNVRVVREYIKIGNRWYRGNRSGCVYEIETGQRANVACTDAGPRATTKR